MRKLSTIWSGAHKRANILAVVFSLSAIVCQGALPRLPRLDSSQFDYKYEMESYLTSEDIDGDGSYDFTANGNVTVECHYGYVDAKFSGNTFYRSEADNGDGCAWRKFVSTLGNDGYTIELCARVNYVGQNNTWAFALSASDGSGCDMSLHFKAGALTWYNTSITNMNTTDKFHTYRVAKLPGAARFVLWCDGVLVNDNLGDAYPDSNLNRLLLGAIGGTYAGRGEFYYLRFAKGVFAPPKKKDLLRDSADFEHKYEMDSNDTRFSPTESTSDWTLGSASGSATLSDGVLSASLPQGSMRYYVTTGPMDSSVTASSPFTLEAKVKVNSVWSGVICTVNFYGGTPRAAYSFFVGPNCVFWGQPNSTGTQLHSGDNTDGMHFENRGHGVNPWSGHWDPMCRVAQPKM